MLMEKNNFLTFSSICYWAAISVLKIMVPLSAAFSFINVEINYSRNTYNDDIVMFTCLF